MSLWSFADCISTPRLDVFAIAGLIVGLAAGFALARLRFKDPAADKSARWILIVACALIGVTFGAMARVFSTGQC